MIYVYGRFLTRQLVSSISTDKLLTLIFSGLIKYHMLISYFLYIAGECKTCKSCKFCELMRFTFLFGMKVLWPYKWQDLMRARLDTSVGRRILDESYLGLSKDLQVLGVCVLIEVPSSIISTLLCIDCTFICTSNSLYVLDTCGHSGRWIITSSLVHLNSEANIWVVS